MRNLSLFAVMECLLSYQAIHFLDFKEVQHELQESDSIRFVCPVFGVVVIP